MVTDSASSLPAALAAGHGVVVVPMWVTIGGHQYRDGEVGEREVLERFGEGVSTSGPSPGDLARAIGAADQGDGVVVLTVSKKMSGVYEAARVAALGLDGTRTSVVDTGSAAGGEGLVVLAAAKAASLGGDFPAVTAAAKAAAASTRLVAMVPTLDHLARSGRVPGLAASGARWLGLGPMFEFRAGRVAPLRPARSRRAAYQRMCSAVARSRPAKGGVHVAVLHALVPDEAQALLERVGEEFPVASCFVGSFGPVMVAHTGPGLVGLAWRWEEAP